MPGERRWALEWQTVQTEEAVKGIWRGLKRGKREGRETETEGKGRGERERERELITHQSSRNSFVVTTVHIA